MAIRTLQEKFVHELGDIYDAENQFLDGQEQMLQMAGDQNLATMISRHIDQTTLHISNLDQIFSLLGRQPDQMECAGAKGLVTEAQKLFKELDNQQELLDCAIAGAADKVEHYEIATYRGLIQAADLMGQREIVSLLQQNLQQEEQTAQLLEQSAPQLLQKAAQLEGAQGMMGRNYEQAGPTL
jgi:ferritin-like metal-binding protein YciE